MIIAPYQKMETAEVKSSVLILIFMLFCLCAWGTKTQPEPTAAPTAAAAEPTTEPTAETVEEAKAETSQSSEEKSAAADITTEAIRELQAVGEQMDASTAFIVLDTAGKSVWKAPLAGIEEFRVPDFMLDAHGGIRATGGIESIPGTQ